jgi:hypothetical protein
VLQCSLKKTWQYGIPKKEPAVFDLKIEKTPADTATALLASEAMSIQGVVEKEHSDYFPKVALANDKTEITLGAFFKQPQLKIELKPTSPRPILDPITIPIEIRLSSDFLHLGFALPKENASKTTIYVVVPPYISHSALLLFIVAILAIAGGALLGYAKRIKFEKPMETKKIDPTLWVTAEVKIVPDEELPPPPTPLEEGKASPTKIASEEASPKSPSQKQGEENGKQAAWEDLPPSSENEKKDLE